MAGLKRRTPKGNGGGSSAISCTLKNGEEYEARLVYVADLGLQERSYKGEEKPPCQQMSLGFEILGETVELDDGTVAPKLMWSKPFNIYHELTEKGVELQMYKIFDPTAEAGVVADWEAVLGMPCNVVNKHFTKDENTYDNVAGITSIPKKYQDSVPGATIEPCVGDADDESNECTKALFGLARYVWEKRLNDYGDDEGYEVPVDPGDIPF